MVGPTLFVVGVNQFDIEVVLDHQEGDWVVSEGFARFRPDKDECAFLLQKGHGESQIVASETEVVKATALSREGSHG
jgi:hypothetical protein